MPVGNQLAHVTHLDFCYNMQKHCGEELTVRHISENGRYVLTDNEGSGTRDLYMWSWSEWMFEERK